MKKAHKANVHGASVGKGGLSDQLAGRARKDGSVAGGEAEEGTSIFDPTLAELLVRWYSPPGGTILDPFAGGSVRGIVSAALGRHYQGIELRPEQVAANREQGDSILKGADGSAEWIEGDSAALMYGIESRQKIKPADMIMTCPPYGDLEVYSRDPADISNMPYGKFRRQLTHILVAAAHNLMPDRFMAVVIGDLRDKRTGHYQGLPAHLVVDMQSIGLSLHNWHILSTPAGSAPARAKTAFVKNRRASLVHQHVIVFVKGNPGEATRAIGEVEYGNFDPARFAGHQGGVADLSAAMSAAME